MQDLSIQQNSTNFSSRIRYVLAPGLNEDAAYGRFPFDKYVMARWDYTRPLEENQQQWDQCARGWLSMDAARRRDFDEISYGALNLEKRIHIPNEEQVLRLFAPHQTVQERNLCLFVRGFTWVRTCYDQSLNSSYAEMAEMYDMICGGESILDNPALYGNLSDDLSDLFLRAPELFFPSYALDEVDLDYEPPEDESRLPLLLAARKERLLVLVIDEESQRRKMPKLAWFDAGGKLVWWNWLQLDSLQDFSGRVQGRGDRLEWIYEISEDVAEWRSKGAVIDLEF